MTGGQVSLSLEAQGQIVDARRPRRSSSGSTAAGLELVVPRDRRTRSLAHEALLAKIAKRSGRAVVWPSASQAGAEAAAAAACVRGEPSAIERARRVRRLAAC